MTLESLTGFEHGTSGLGNQRLNHRLYINDLPDGVIYGIGIYADDTIPYSWCDLAYDLLQQLELVSELESDLQGTVDWVGK